MHTGPGGSLSATLADLETIWSHVIQKQLDIPLKDLKVGEHTSLSNMYIYFMFYIFLAFQYYRCILLVPDIYNRQHIKEVVNMLLLNMGFSGIVVQKCVNIHVPFSDRSMFLPCVCIAIIVHQESVCATFGSGLSSACVVDVGDQKTSLCCVEDGVSHRNSRSD